MLHGFLNLHAGVEPVDAALRLMADTVAAGPRPGRTRAVSSHPAIAAKLHLLDGIDGWQELADPEKAARMQEFDSWPGAAAAPDVDVRADSVPGPHGPVPVRIYTPPAPSGDDRRRRWSGCTAARSSAATSTCVEADGVAREICARAGAVVVSVDYRLCHGGVTYPVPHDDVVAAVRWVRDAAAELGRGRRTDLRRGRERRRQPRGGRDPPAPGRRRLAAGRRWCSPIPSPTRCCRRPRRPCRAHGGLPRMLRFLPEDTAFINANFLGGAHSRADGYAMPGLAVLDGLCPVLVLDAEFDDLRPSGEALHRPTGRGGRRRPATWSCGACPTGSSTSRPAALEPVDQALDLIAAVVSA